jgi:xanthine dehydrogenase small subunit
VRSVLRFIRRGKIVELSGLDPARLVLDYLREDDGSRGTKEGCAEGDCGACTIALGRLEAGRVVYEPFNACILLMGQIDGKELVTVEDLADRDSLHPVQQALVAHHGSQCGFCTPGIVMSLFALYHSGRQADRKTVEEQLAGNLCRCTGYRPIVEAALTACSGAAEDRHAHRMEETVRLLRAIQDEEDLRFGGEERFFAAPRSTEALSELALAHPDATFLAGGTDVGLWLTKQLRDLPKFIHLGRVRSLAAIEDTSTMLLLGAAATYEAAVPYLARIDADLGELVRRVGGKQVRASGTIGGNIANGSPIGDMPPALIALGATLDLWHGPLERSMALEDFFIAYGKQERKPGELVWRIRVPKLKPNEVFRCYKVTKRFDQDITAVLGSFKFTMEGDAVAKARVAFGGMAGTPKRALLTESALSGARPDDRDSWEPALGALAYDYRPISDHRASADYRIETARALLTKAMMELAGRNDTRIIPRRETVDAG